MSTPRPGVLRRTVAAPGKAWRAFRDQPLGEQRLYYGRPRPAAQVLAGRLLLALLLVALTVLAVIWHRDGLKDNIDGHVSVIDAIYFTFITLTTVGYGDIVPVTHAARLFDALFVTPVRLLLWAIFIGTAYQFVVKRIVEDLRMRIRQSELEGHVVVCGYGLGGRSAVEELLRRGEPPEKIVVVDEDEAEVREAAELGVVGLRGDATRERVLGDALVQHARTAIVCLATDANTILCVLTLRALAPGLRIVALVRENENERLMRQGGADMTVCPSTLSGTLLANALDSSNVTDYVHDMLTVDGRVLLTERDATPADVGCEATRLADGIALRIHRGDRVIGFWEPEARIAAGDRLIVLTPRTAGGGQG